MDRYGWVHDFWLVGLSKIESHTKLSIGKEVVLFSQRTQTCCFFSLYSKYAHTHTHTHTLLLCREPDDSLDSSLSWLRGWILPDAERRVWSLISNTHRYAYTYWLFSSWFQGPEGPGDDNGTGVDGRGTLECAFKANIRAVDCLHIPRCVYTHPIDLQHAYSKHTCLLQKLQFRTHRAHSISINSLWKKT